MLPPCTVPTSLRVRVPSSSTPAFSHFWMSRTKRRPCTPRWTLFHCPAVSLPRRPAEARRRVSLQRLVRGAQPLDVVHVVQERREPLLPVPPCCLTHPLERTERTCPARCPERVAPGRVPLGQL